MTTTQLPVETARAHWACVRLRVPITASSEESRAARFDRLRESGFTPSAEVAEAVHLLSGRPEPPHLTGLSPFAREREQNLLLATEAFADKYFELTHIERRARWQELMLEAQAYPAARQRLRELQAGLELPVNIPADAPPSVAALMLFLRQLFVAPPAAKSMLRRHVIRTARAGNLREAARAAQTIAINYPGTAGLDRQLIERLRYFLEGTFPRRATATPKPTPSFRPPTPRPAVEPVSSSSDGEGWDLRRGAMVAIGLAISLVMGLIRGSSTSHAPPRVHIPEIRLPTPPPKADFHWIYRALWPQEVIKAVDFRYEPTADERSQAAAATVKFFHRQKSLGEAQLCSGLGREEAEKLRQILASILREEFGVETRDDAVPDVHETPAIAEVPQSEFTLYSAEDLEHIISVLESRSHETSGVGQQTLDLRALRELRERGP